MGPLAAGGTGAIWRLGLLLALTGGSARAAAQARVLFVPLDDRPTSADFPRHIAAIAGAHVIAPPDSLLGRFTTPGRPDAVARWLAQQPTTGVTAAVVSLDMLAVGGLVASRRAEAAGVFRALARLDALRELRRQAPDLPILATNVLMRLAPTADGRDEAWRVPLARWAAIADDSTPAAVEARRRLEDSIPAVVHERYVAARRRGQALNGAAVTLVRDGVLTHLLLSQDDAHPDGVQRREQEQLRRRIHDAGVASRAVIQPGTDEAGMLLMTRALATRASVAPLVRVHWSAPEDSARVFPFEDRPLAETVRTQLAATGARVAPMDTGAVALELFVFTSRRVPGAASAFAARVRQARHPAIVADVDPRGDVQGADSVFTEALLSTGRFGALAGYASWNTAGNTLGTAIAMGVASRLPMHDAAAHRWFLAHRLLDDYAYRTLARRRVTGTPDLRAVGAHAPRLLGAGWPTCRLPQPPTVTLPWDRAFEARIDFALRCD